jgi:hypothetical protein
VALRRKPRPSGRSREYVTFAECPLCGYEFEKGECRPDHFVEEHTPEDAGLGGEPA